MSSIIDYMLSHGNKNIVLVSLDYEEYIDNRNYIVAAFVERFKSKSTLWELNTAGEIECISDSKMFFTYLKTRKVQFRVGLIPMGGKNRKITGFKGISINILLLSDCIGIEDREEIIPQFAVNVKYGGKIGTFTKEIVNE